MQTTLMPEVPAASDGPAEHVQRAFDDLGTPLIDVTFCVVDLETTGGSPTDCAITEVGAVKLHGGECLGTFQTMVNPGMAIPPEITVLTGITQAMVLPAPRIETVLPSLLEFVGDSVVVGHNVRFDLGFINAALERDGRPRLSNRSVDTAALARRLVRDEVPNCKLGTLAKHLRLDHRPSHRALDDALATGDLLHLLLERSGRMGVTGLDDLLALPTIKGHEQADKLALTDDLPRHPGVYVFRDRRGEVLYVGKATNLRTRVRSYFSGDRRRKITQLLRETERIDHRVCADPIEAAVHEVRLIHEHRPRFNRRAKTWQKYAYLKLTLNERFPRFSVVRAPRDDGALYLGPLASSRTAQRVAEAVESVIPLRRCKGRVPHDPRPAPCAPAQLGVAACPCSGRVSEAAYAQIVHRAVRGLTVEPELVLEPLASRMVELAAEERFEEAAEARDRANALSSSIARQRAIDRLRSSGSVVIRTQRGATVHFEAGRLSGSVPPGDDRSLELDLSLAPDSIHPTADGGDAPASETSGLFANPTDAIRPPIPADLADEMTAVSRWLDEESGRLRLLHAGQALMSHLPPLASYHPKKKGPGRNRER